MKANVIGSFLYLRPKAAKLADNKKTHWRVLLLPPAWHKLCLCFTRPKATKLADNKTQVLSFRTLCEESLIEIFPPFSRQNDKVVWFRI